MDSEGRYDSPFASHGLWRRSTFTLPEAADVNLFRDAHLDIIDGTSKPLFTDLQSDGLYSENLNPQLIDLDNFHFGRLGDVSPPETVRPGDADSSCSAQSQSGPPLVADDVWQLSLELPTNEPKLRTWEAFLSEDKRQDYDEKRVVYISEAGPRAFDAALHKHARGDEEAGHVLQSAFFIKSLSLLGEGRSSALFQWDASTGAFKQTLQHVRPSGFSLAAAQSVIKELGQIGSSFVELREFVGKTYAARRPLSARVALAKCVQVILETLEQELAASVPGVKSALQLVDQFRIPSVILGELHEFVTVSSSARSDLACMKMVYQTVQELAQSCSPYHKIHLDILDRVSQPWTHSVSGKVGLSHGESLDIGGSEDEESIEGLVSAEEYLQVNELMSGLDILRDSCSDHPLLNPTSWKVEQPGTQHFNHQVEAARILDKAQTYEADLMDAIKKFDRGQRPNATYSLRPNVQIMCDESMAWQNSEQQQEYFATIGGMFEELPGRRLDPSDSIPEGLRYLTSLAVCHNSHDESIADQEAATADLDELKENRSPLRSLQPFLQAQSRLVNGTVLRLLFRQHDFRRHLRLQHSFHLFGSGVFVHRLSTALFSADSSSAERRTGEVIGKQGNSLGLRLDSRSKWPPGGSELRLALMGVLSESYHNGSLDEMNRAQSGELPGGLSFSIRELEDAEIEKILDPHSIFALDFLRLSYEPPKPLDVLITDTCMERYDEVFRFLLRLIRMIHVTTKMKMLAALSLNRSGRSAKAFAFLAYHFVASLAGYIFDVGIGSPWIKFTAALDNMESELDTEDESGAYGNIVRTGLVGLKALHEGTLDSIRTRLLLRQKQSRIRDVLESIFSRILDVWRRLHSDDADGASNVAEGDVSSLKEDVKRLLDLLGDMGRKAVKRAVTGRGVDEKEDLEAVNMLRLRLDLNGFYLQSKDVLML